MSNLRTEHEIEIDQIHGRQLAEKDAEIERLLDKYTLREGNLKLFITELVDALEEEFGPVTERNDTQRPWDLMKRVRDGVMSKVDYAAIARFIRGKDTEIGRLKVELETEIAARDLAYSENTNLRKITTELADALDGPRFDAIYQRELVQRAREATSGR